MDVKKLQVAFYILLLAGVGVLFYLVAAPYVGAIFLALVTTVLFRPMYEHILSAFGGRHNAASLVSVIIVILVITIPLLFVGNLLIKESASFYLDTQNDQIGGMSFAGSIAQIETYLEAKIPGADFDLERFLDIGAYADQGFKWLASHVSAFFSGLLQLSLSTFLYVLCLFYLFRDGHTLKKNVLAWSPLFDSYDNLIIQKITTAVSSVLRGQLMIGLIQGLLTGLGFWIFGVSNPVIWGVVAAIASLVPAIGTSLINGPAIIYLALSGNLPQAFGLLAWAGVAVGLIDNILGPQLINRGVKIHPFLILISVLGGISFFGPVGFIAGPVVLSLLFALLELYPTILKPKSSA